MDHLAWVGLLSDSMVNTLFFSIYEGCHALLTIRLLRFDGLRVCGVWVFYLWLWGGWRQMARRCRWARGLEGKVARVKGRLAFIYCIRYRSIGISLIYIMVLGILHSLRGGCATRNQTVPPRPVGYYLPHPLHPDRIRVGSVYSPEMIFSWEVHPEKWQDDERGLLSRLGNSILVSRHAPP